MLVPVVVIPDKSAAGVSSNLLTVILPVPFTNLPFILLALAIKAFPEFNVTCFVPTIPVEFIVTVLLPCSVKIASGKVPVKSVKSAVVFIALPLVLVNTISDNPAVLFIAFTVIFPEPLIVFPSRRTAVDTNVLELSIVNVLPVVIAFEDMVNVWSPSNLNAALGKLPPNVTLFDAFTLLSLPEQVMFTNAADSVASKLLIIKLPAPPTTLLVNLEASA